MKPNVISMIFILCSILTFYCVLHKQLYRSAGFVLHLKSNFIFSCFRKGTDHLGWRSSPPAVFASPAWLMAHWYPEAKGPAFFFCVIWGGESALLSDYQNTPSQQTQGSKVAQREFNKPALWRAAPPPPKDLCLSLQITKIYNGSRR